MRDITIEAKYSGIDCNGDATIILEDTNTVIGQYNNFSCINVPKGKTLTIKGICYCFVIA